MSASDSLPLLKGTLDMLVLKGLSIEPTHGYGLSVWLERTSDGHVTVEDSAIYQALRRLEGKRYVEAEWGVTENNRRARYYRLTARGREHLEEELRTWDRYTRWVGELLESEEPASG